tara:strand:+ start:960 stop:1220 length:261 start_codon:yes stop_codon:yes gene_type:complete
MENFNKSSIVLDVTKIELIVGFTESGPRQLKATFNFLQGTKIVHTVVTYRPWQMNTTEFFDGKIENHDTYIILEHSETIEKGKENE